MTDVSSLPPSMIVEVDGRGLSSDEWSMVESIEVDQRVGTIDYCEIRFYDRPPASESPKPPTFSMGDGIKVFVVDDSGTEQIVFDGEITSNAYNYGYEFSTVIYEAHDRRHQLIRQLAPASKMNQPLKDTLEAAISAAGLTTDIDANLGTTNLTTQLVGMTTFELLRHFQTITGSYSFIDDRGRLAIRPLDKLPTSLVEVDNRKLVSFDVRYSPVERAESVAVIGWDQTKGETISSESSMKAPLIPQINTSTSTPWAEATFLTANRHVVSATHAQAHADAAARHFRNHDVRGHGEISPDGKLRAGEGIKVSNIHAQFDGKYPVSAVQHRLERGEVTTRFQVGPADETLAGVATDQELPTPTITVGRVTDIADPDKRGRVKVKLPLMGADLESDWLRIMSVGGSKDRGIGFVPEVNDEVLVAFVHGNVDQGYVIGTVWNDAGGFFQNAVTNGEIVERRIAARLTMNQLRFIDKKKGDTESGVSLEADDAKSKLFLGYTKTELVTEDRPLEIKNGEASILLDKDKITISAKEIALNATGKLTVDGKEVAITGKTTTTVEGKTQVTVKSVKPTIEGSAMTQIKGNPVKVN